LRRQTVAKKPTLTFARPRNKSLQAYKEWFRAICASLGVDPAEAELTDEEYEEDWKEFWGGEGAEAGEDKPAPA